MKKITLKLDRINKIADGGYYLVHAPDAYPGVKYDGRYAPEHRVIYWWHHKKLPPNGWHIHHINGDPKDNRIENLQAITATEHAKMVGHIADLDPESYATLTCYQCHIEFKQLERTIKFREKQGQNQFFCGHSCHTTYQNQFRKGKSINYPTTRKSSGRKGEDRICKICNTTYYVSPYKLKTATACSLSCAARLRALAK